MNEDKLFQLLGAIVKQNADIIEQNERFLIFLRERDAKLAERTELEIQNLIAINAENARMREVHARYDGILQAMGVSKEDLQAIEILKGIGVYGAGKEVRARLKQENKLLGGDDL